MSTTRRTVVRGAAWSVPVVMVAAQAPAFAASTCASVGYDLPGWAFAVTSVSGSLNTGTGFTGLVGLSYQSEQDNASTATETLSNRTVTITGTRNLTLVVGRTYTFTFSILSRYSGDNAAGSQNQYLRISIGGVDRIKVVKGANSNTWLGSTATNGYTQLSTSSPVTETFSFTFTPTAANETLTYVFVLPPRGKVGSGTWSGQADISISAPTITANGC